MFHDIRRNAAGKWELRDMDASADVVVFTHTSQLAVVAYAAERAAPPAEPGPLPPPHAALARVEAMQNELIAQHVNTWGAYEIPRYGIDARVIHKPSGKLCVVRGFMAFTPPIVLYSLTELDGMPLPLLVTLSDISDPLEDTVVLPQSSGGSDGG